MLIKFDEVTVEIEEYACKTLKRFIQRKGFPEAGGIIVGKYNPIERKYVITEATAPSILDVRAFSYFIRKAKPAQEIINARWEASGGLINYLGEWHTHGCNVPVPSNTDLRLIQSIILDKSNVWPEVIMIIVGRQSWYIGVASVSNSNLVVESKYIEVT